MADVIVFEETISVSITEEPILGVVVSEVEQGPAGPEGPPGSGGSIDPPGDALIESTLQSDGAGSAIWAGGIYRLDPATTSIDSPYIFGSHGERKLCLQPKAQTAYVVLPTLEMDYQKDGFDAATIAATFPDDHVAEIDTSNNEWMADDIAMLLTSSAFDHAIYRDLTDPVYDGHFANSAFTIGYALGRREHFIFEFYRSTDGGNSAWTPSGGTAVLFVSAMDTDGLGSDISPNANGVLKAYFLTKAQFDLLLGLKAAAFLDVGSIAGTVCAGDDGRLSDSRSPTSHTHTQSDSHNSADTDNATTSLHHTLGTGANQAAAGNHTHVGAAAAFKVGISAVAFDLIGVATEPLLAGVDGTNRDWMELQYADNTASVVAFFEIPAALTSAYAGGSLTIQINTRFVTVTNAKKFVFSCGLASVADSGATDVAPPTSSTGFGSTITTINTATDTAGDNRIVTISIPAATGLTAGQKWIGHLSRLVTDANDDFTGTITVSGLVAYE